MKAMILAAGLGKRMLPLTKITPKPLLKVNDKSLIEYSLINLQKAGIKQLVINLHYLGDQIKNFLGNGSKWGVQISYSEEPDLLDTAGGILKALNNNLLGSEPFMVLSADLITDFDFSSLKLQQNSLAHLVLVANPDFNIKGDFSIKEGQLDFIDPHKPSFTYANIGIFDPKFFSGYAQSKIPLVNLIHKWIKQKQITAEIHYGLWANIGSLKELQAANSWQI